MAEPQRADTRRAPARTAAPWLALERVDVPQVSLVVPMQNERRSVEGLLEECRSVLDDASRDWRSLGLERGETPRWEILFVDDGSTDGCFGLVKELAETDTRVRAIRLRRHLGKSVALAVGFSHARAERIISLDADLQDDPREIPRMLDALAQGFDLVSGWKRKRHDSVARVVASRVFNSAVRRVSGVGLHDLNCGFKAYRRAVTQDVRLYGELHRFIPVLAAWKGYRVGELEVRHRPRRHGRSRYGWGRAFRGAMDLVTVMFLTRFDSRPAHFFGLPGASLLSVGACILGYIAYLRLAHGWIMSRHPLLMLGVLLVLAGLQLFTTGLLGEMLVAHFPRSDAAIIRDRVGDRAADRPGERLPDRAADRATDRALERQSESATDSAAS